MTEIRYKLCTGNFTVHAQVANKLYYYYYYYCHYYYHYHCHYYHHYLDYHHYHHLYHHHLHHHHHHDHHHHHLRIQYSQKKVPAIKTRINQSQKQVKEEFKVESLVSWKKFCNLISLETNSNESWGKIKNFLKPNGQRDYSTLRHASKVAKTNADKAQLYAESVERHFGIESAHLIRITSIRSINLSRIIIDIFILLKTQMTTDLMWEMSTSFGTVANGTLPGRKYICSPLKSEVNIFGFRRNFWFVIESIAYED